MMRLRMLRHRGEKLPRKLKKQWRKQVYAHNVAGMPRRWRNRVRLWYSPEFGWSLVLKRTGWSIELRKYQPNDAGRARADD